MTPTQHQNIQITQDHKVRIFSAALQGVIATRSHDALTLEQAESIIQTAIALTTDAIDAVGML